MKKKPNLFVMHESKTLVCLYYVNQTAFPETEKSTI